MEDVSDDDSFLAAVLNDLAQIDLLLDEDGGVEDDYDEWKCDPDRPRTIEQAYARWGTDRGWKDEVRYSQEQFEYLAEQLVIPELFPTAEQQQRTKTLEKVGQGQGKLVFAMTLSRLAHASTVKGQMEFKWGYHRTVMTKWTNACIDWLFDEWGHVLTMTAAATGPRVARYAEAVGKKIGLSDPTRCRVFGFIDGVFIEHCRPRLFQENVYSGYYKGHGMKFQAIVTAGGLVEDLYGPESGRHHDIYLWYESRVADELDLFPDPPNGGRYVIYGDSAYRKRRAAPHIAVAFDWKGFLTPQQRRYNKLYNRVRVTVEWAFGHVYRLWTHFRNRPNLRTGQSTIGRRYMVAVFLYNCKTCMDGGNQISLFFKCAPPKLPEYLDVEKPERGRYADVLEMYEAAVAVYGREGLRQHLLLAGGVR